MKRITEAPDIAGRSLFKGDTVASTNGQITGKIWDLADDDGTAFVQLKPVHQPYARPVWYASDQVIWVATAKTAGRSDTKDKAVNSSVDSVLAVESPPDSPDTPASPTVSGGKPAAASGPSPAKRRNGSAARKK